MSRIVYVNGSFVPEADAKISVFDRAFLFADGVYEVTAVVAGRPLDLDGHLRRLDRSLAEMQIDPPLTHAEWRDLHAELIARNKVDEGIVYLEVTRGVADRDFLFPEGATPTVVAFTQSRKLLDNPYAETGVKVDHHPRSALEAPRHQIDKPTGADDGQAAGEAWRRVRGVDGGGWVRHRRHVLDRLHSRRRRRGPHAAARASHPAGVTRRAVLRLAETKGLGVEERPFTVAEAKQAREAFMSAASAFVLPVVEIDGKAIGDGTPGPVAQEFRRLYIEEAMRS